MIESIERVRLANAILTLRLHRVRNAVARLTAANDQLAETVHQFTL